MNKKTYSILFLILLISSFLRIWNLGHVPPSPDWDEAALGYNAYSIMLTGKDEFGKFLPVVLQSFGDYKPALYAYLIIPFIKLFGLSVFSVRLPSAIFGILTVFATYFLIKELFPAITIIKKQVSGQLALLTSLSLAVSPWHIQFSRIAFESNVGLAFNVFSVLFFLKGIRKSFYLFVSILCMSLSIYVYQSEKVFTPLMAIVLVFIYRKQVSKKILSALVVFGFILMIPMLIFILSNNRAFARAEGVSIFSSHDTPAIAENNNKLLVDHMNHDSLGLIMDNRRILFVKDMINGYISHFDPNWLFVNGDPTITRHHVPFMGLLYIWSIPFILIGIYILFFSSEKEGLLQKSKILVFAWLLIAPIPASVTYDTPHAVRTLNYLPIWDVFIALGVLQVYLFLSDKAHAYLRYGAFVVLALIMCLNVGYFFDQYFVQQNYYYAFDWQYGYKDIVNYVKPLHNRFTKVVVSDKGDMSQSYIFFLFYLQYDPSRYLAEGGTRPENYYKFSNFEFRPFNYDAEGHNELLVGAPSDFDKVYKTVFEVNYPDKKLAMKAVEKE